MALWLGEPGPNEMKTPGLVIFDCDGVLVDSVPLIERVIRDALEQHGLQFQPDEEWPFHGLSNAHIVDEVTTRWCLTLPLDFSDVVNRTAWDVMERELRAIPGVVEAVSSLHDSKIAICVASSGSPQSVEHRLRITGLYQWFEGGVFGADDSIRPKPFPDVFLKAAETIGFQPSECVVIEDSEAGVQAGKAAGMRVLLFSSKPGNSIGKLDDVTQFTDMTLLPALLGL